jgi:glycosyltransferase involved in cell wall biosynthesis
MKNKKIVFILESLGQGGSERQILRLASNFSKMDYKVLILTYHANSFYDTTNIVNHNLEICELCCKNKFKRLFFVRKKIRNFKADVIVSLILSTSIYAVLSTIDMHLKHVLTWRFINNKIFYGINGIILNIICRFSKNIVFNSYAGMKLWLKHRPYDYDKLKVIYNLIDMKNFLLPNKMECSELPDKVQIIVAARIVPVKNPDGLIRALTLLSENERNRLSISWYGQYNDNDNYFKKIKRQIEQFNLDSILKLKPPVENIEQLMSNANVIALFSHSEGFPNAICEGMLAGKTIIMPPISDYKVLIGANGYIINSSSADSIAATLRKLLYTSADEFVSMGRLSRKRAQNLFNNDDNMRMWVEVINNDD